MINHNRPINRSLWQLALLFFLVPLLRGAGDAQIFDPATLRKVLSAHDPIWTEAPDQWFDGAPLGNGDIGAMVWCAGDRLILTLDKTDLWEKRNFQPDPAKYTWANYRRILAEKRAAKLVNHTAEEIRDFQRPRRKPMGSVSPEEFEPPYVTRLPLGRLELRFTGKLQDFAMRLHLAEGKLEGKITTSEGSLVWSAYVHALHPLVVLEWSTEGSQEVRPDVRLAVDADSYAPKIRDQLRSWSYGIPAREFNDGIQSATEAMPAGGEYDVSTRLVEANPAGAQRTMFLTISHSPDSRSAKTESRSRLASLQPNRGQELSRAHSDWWQKYYPASFLTVPDTRLEALYWMEMYRLGAGTRPDKLPFSLEGAWTADSGIMPRFAGSYYWNMDTQMTYWPIYTANRLDFGEPLYCMIDNMRPALRKFCREFFGVDGEFLRIGTDMHGNSTYMSPTVVVEFEGLPWVAHHYWLHYRYTMDTEFLKQRAVPLMKAALVPYLSELKPGPDGLLHLEFSESPEYSPPGKARWGQDATIDLSLIRALCGWLLEADRILQTGDPDRQQWQSTLEKLAPYPRDRDGGLAIRADQDLISSHRHHSHLMPIYPLKLITLENERALVEKSLAHWKFQGTGEWTGWSYGWGASIAAHTDQAHLARTLLLDYVDHFVSPSGLHMDGVRNESYMTVWKEHQVLTLEAGFGAANALQDMLLQSHGGIIRLFPGSPWSAAAFWSLRAEGAFLVSARRNGGRLEFAQLKSLRGGRCQLLLPDNGAGLIISSDGKLNISSDGKLNPLAGERRLLAFDTVPGETIVLSLPNVSQQIEALKPVESEQHFFGRKKVRPALWDAP